MDELYSAAHAASTFAFAFAFTPHDAPHRKALQLIMFRALMQRSARECVCVCSGTSCASFVGRCCAQLRAARSCAELAPVLHDLLEFLHVMHYAFTPTPTSTSTLMQMQRQ
jgi:hypothetical protein